MKKCLLTRLSMVFWGLSLLLPPARPNDVIGFVKTRLVNVSESVLDLYPASDSYVNQNAPGANYSKADTLHVRRDEFGQESFALLRFDLSTIPPGSVVNSASINMHLALSDDLDSIFPRLSVFWVFGNWDPDMVTWNTKPSTILTAHVLTSPNIIDWYEWEIADMVQCWVDRQIGCTDASLALRPHPDESNSFIRDFESLEGSLRPYLHISYTPPGSPPSIGGRVWFDGNRNANPEDSEHGLNGVELSLSQGGIVLSTSTTSSSGNYLFSNLTPGVAYQVDVNDATLPASYYFLTTSSDPLMITPGPDEQVRDALFGYAPPECIPPAITPTPSSILDVDLWPAGCIPFKFETGPSFELTETDKGLIRAEAQRWNEALFLPDPANLSQKRLYIQFYECSDDCPQNYVMVQYNKPGDDGNMCGNAGRTQVGETRLHFARPASGILSRNTVLHELGHCIGLWHEHNRIDAEAWLEEAECYEFNPRPASKMPLLGNFDYDSIMIYQSKKLVSEEDGCAQGVDQYKDLKQHTFSRFLNRYPSKRDISRVLQYYAWERERNWGFFFSINQNILTPEVLPDPSMADGVAPVGTPGIAYQSSGNYDLFVLGSDQNLYWKAYRNNSPQGWQSLGCCFASEPSAVSRGNGQIDLVAIGAETVRPVHNHYQAGSWSRWQYILDDSPSLTIKPGFQAGMIGPAIAARTPHSLDVFVVKSDGLLAMTTMSDGQWSAWRSLGLGYNITARPAAVALSETQVQLAINSNDTDLYEPLVTFPPLVPSFTLGILKGTTAFQAPPALARREDPDNPYRVLITNPEGRISHRFARGSWWDIGGIPMPGEQPITSFTGSSAVATGPYDVYIVMNGENVVGCDIRCCDTLSGNNKCNETGPSVVHSEFIQWGGLWLRKFEDPTQPHIQIFLPSVLRDWGRR